MGASLTQISKIADETAVVRIHDVFATRLLEYDVPDAAVLNMELARLILEQEQSEQGVVRSNVGGWHSSDEFLASTSSPVLKLRESILEAVTAYIPTTPTGARVWSGRISAIGWANVCRQGDYNRLHIHPRVDLSGVYYVSGEATSLMEEGSGALEFVDPRASVETNPIIWQQTDSRIRVLPHPGKMIIFPCWLYHYVNPYRGETPRISVAFNVVFGRDI